MIATSREGCEPGYMLRHLLPLVGLNEVPECYIRKVLANREARKLQQVYQTPVAGKGQSDLHRHGLYTKVPEEQRLIGESKDPWEHLRKAETIKFPRRDGAADLPPLVRASARAIAHVPGNLAVARRQWLQEWRGRNTLEMQELDAHILSHMPSGTPFKYKLASMGADLEGLYHLDDTKLLDLFVGMATVDFGDDHVRQTGLYRPVAKPAQYTVQDLFTGRARPLVARMVDGKRVLEEGKPHKSSAEWFEDVVRQTTSDAQEALQNAGISEDRASRAVKDAMGGSKSAIGDLLASVADQKARKRLEKLLMCELKTHEETITAPRRKGEERGAPPTMKQPRSVQEHRTWAKEVGGIGAGRVSRRFVIDRGLKADGSAKLRCIDDLRRSGVTGCCSTPEMTDLPANTFIAQTAAEINSEWRRVWHEDTEVTGGLDDQRFAYRGVHAKDHPRVNSVIFYSFKDKGAKITEAYGHLLGKKCGNNNYSRVPRAACIAAATYFLVPAHHYVDDIMNADRKEGELTAQECIQAILEAWGFEVELSKRVSNREKPDALGATTDLSRVKSHGVAAVEPAKEKTDALMRQLALCKANGECTPQEADVIKNKTRWMTGQHEMHSGAAALQPFAQRARGLDETSEWTPAMDFSKEFFDVVFSEEFKPKLEIPTGDDRDSDEPCLIVYSDASEEGAKGERVSRASILIYDQADGRYYEANDIIPREYMAAFFEERDTYIGVDEEAAGVAALYTFPELFYGRRVISFVDNAGSLSHLVNGYAGRADSAQIVNLFHAALIALQVKWWGEWVPSAANVADIMTRPERFDELLQGLQGRPLTRRALTLPPLHLVGRGKLSEWMRDMRQKAQVARERRVREEVREAMRRAGVKPRARSEDGRCEREQRQRAERA